MLASRLTSRAVHRDSPEPDDTVCGRWLGDALTQPSLSGRVAWSTASHWLDRALDHDVEAFDAAFASHAATAPLHRALTATFARPATTYRVLLSLAPELAPVELRHLELSRGTLSLELRLRPHLRGCEGLFRAWAGIVRGLPRLHARADARVRSEVSATHGFYVAELGAGATVARRSARASGCELLEALAQLDLTTRGAVLAQILRSLDEVPDRRSSFALLQERLGITQSEARVAVSLADGKLVADIARELGMADATVRTHLRNIYRKTGATRQVELVTLVHRALSNRSGIGALRLHSG
jgi:DNA-binding CsgD family transcriptional regulator